MCTRNTLGETRTIHKSFPLPSPWPVPSMYGCCLYPVYQISFCIWFWQHSCLEMSGASMHHTHHHILYMWAWTGTFTVRVCTVRSLVCTCRGTTSQLNIGPFPPQTNLLTFLYMENCPNCQILNFYVVWPLPIFLLHFNLQRSEQQIKLVSPYM